MFIKITDDLGKSILGGRRTCCMRYGQLPRVILRMRTLKLAARGSDRPPSFINLTQKFIYSPRIPVGNIMQNKGFLTFSKKSHHLISSSNVIAFSALPRD